MDRITLRGVRVYGRHGANPGERDLTQPFDIEIVTELDLRVAQVSDDLADTLDYAALHRRIVEIVRTRSYALLERLAGDLLDAIFDDARVIRAQVTIEKPAILDGATPGVTLARERY
jgi:7,8-dihydroneopterin aldolase/epimerase/oxygenase